jgi:hypothetical protein
MVGRKFVIKKERQIKDVKVSVKNNFNIFT